jgi:hypothetical protein
VSQGPLNSPGFQHGRYRPDGDIGSEERQSDRTISSWPEVSYQGVCRMLRGRLASVVSWCRVITKSGNHETVMNEQ